VRDSRGVIEGDAEGNFTLGVIKDGTKHQSGRSNRTERPQNKRKKVEKTVSLKNRSRGDKNESEFFWDKNSKRGGPEQETTNNNRGGL